MHARVVMMSLRKNDNLTPMAKEQNIGISRSQNVIYIVIALKRRITIIWFQPFYYPYYSVPTSSAIAKVETRKWPFKVD